MHASRPGGVLVRGSPRERSATVTGHHHSGPSIGALR